MDVGLICKAPLIVTVASLVPDKESVTLTVVLPATAGAVNAPVLLFMVPDPV